MGRTLSLHLAEVVVKITNLFAAKTPAQLCGAGKAKLE